MKRRKLAFLIVPIILLAFVSCEGDIFGTISDFMGQTGENVLVSGGLVGVNTQQVDAVSQSVSTMADENGDPDPEKVTQVKEDLKNVLDSPKKTEALKTDLAKDISGESQTTTAGKLETQLDGIKADLGIDDADLDFKIKTEADLLVATLIVDIANNFGDLDEDDEDQLIALASEALFVVEVIKAVSPTGMVDLDDAVNDLLTSFLNDQDEE